MGLAAGERQQDFAYQQEVEGNPAQRHLVRFWRCPEGWRLPGGRRVDWVAAGTYDRSVGLSLMTFQVTHRIAPDIDAERDHIVVSLTDADPGARVDTIRHFATGYHARNGGGDQIVTDGHLPVVDLVGVLVAGLLVVAPEETTFFTAEAEVGTGVRIGAGSAVVAVALLDVTLGVATFRGRNWARVC